MDLSRHRLESETDTHWEIVGPGGKFRVAKAGVGPKIRDAIAQHFANGGEVLDMAESMRRGEPVPEVGADAPPSVAPEGQAFPLTAAVPPVLLPTAAAAQYLLGRSRGDQQPDSSDLADPSQHAVLAPSDPSTKPDWQAMAAAQQSPQPAPARPVVAPQVRVSSYGARAQRDLDAAYEQGATAAQGAADVARAEADATLGAMDRQEQAKADFARQWDARRAQWEERGARVRRDVADAKIDPNQFWATRSTGQKISAAIGMMLGGLGSGLTGGPNPVIQLVDNAIQRDLDAQAANLKQKNTLLSLHMQEGADLAQARQLAKADMLDASAAMLQRVSVKFAGERAQANAQAQIADLTRRAALERQAVAAQGLDMSLKGLQIEGAKAALGAQAAQAAAMRGATASGSQQAAMELMSDSQRERAVPAPDGRIYFLPSKENAEKARGQVQGFLQSMAAIEDMRRLRKELGVGGALSPSLRAQGKMMQDQMIGSMRLALVGPGAVTDSEREFMRQMIPNPAEWMTTDAIFEARLRELKQKAYDGMVTSLQAGGAQVPRVRLPESKE